MKYLLMITLVISVCLAGSPGWSSKAYVTDSLTIGLRAEPNIENNSIDFLSSGQMIEVLDMQGDWSHIQYEKEGQGTQSGWILSRYLMSRLPWEIQANSIKENNTRLVKELEETKKELKEAAHRADIVETKLNKLTAELQESEDEYTALKEESFDYIRLKTAYEAMKNNVDHLTKENETLNASQMNRWIMTGALILLCGLLLGLLLGRQEKKRKTYY
ncbi:MAG: TIGR04211 family SH3 domain-containing protein [Deltaproteobacteria bacterium]|nr:TIGR04211 family SH3 domain-containing protein [Deltaproteobacteria bacterium]